jgi:hypothetical protein
METEEQRNDEKKFAEEWPNMSRCWTEGRPRTMPDCCKSIGEAVDCRSMMSKCMKGCRWFPLVPVVLGIAFFVLGYYLDAEITRILWMVAAGLVILMGTLGAVMMRVMIR